MASVKEKKKKKKKKKFSLFFTLLSVLKHTNSSPHHQTNRFAFGTHAQANKHTAQIQLVKISTSHGTTTAHTSPSATKKTSFPFSTRAPTGSWQRPSFLTRSMRLPGMPPVVSFSSPPVSALSRSRRGLTSSLFVRSVVIPLLSIVLHSPIVISPVAVPTLLSRSGLSTSSSVCALFPLSNGLSEHSRSVIAALIWLLHPRMSSSMSQTSRLANEPPPFNAILP
jgi:hypothetical protein